MRRERGITLIALVITIIVLIILAGVSIQLLLGENGIITKAKKGKGDYQEASVKEKVEMALADYNSDKIVNGEEGEIEEALNKLYDNNTFDDIEIEENIGIIDNYEITLGKEKGEVIIDGIDKVTGSMRLRCKVSTKEYTKESITIHVKASGNIAKLIKPDDKEVTPVNGKIEIDYLVNENGTYIFKVEDAEGTPLEKPVIVDNIDTLPPQNFDITAQQVDKKIVITANTEDTTDETGKSACSGIDRYEYFVKKVTDTDYPATPYLTNEIEISEYGTYKILVKAYDKAGNPKDCNEEITIEIVNPKPLKYGQKVNYSANGINDWKIFYINEERNETFIITSDYLPKAKIPQEKTGIENKYALFWGSPPSYVENSSEILSKFMLKWQRNKTNTNIRCISTLLYPDAWSNFVTEELKGRGGMAVGSPTLEMFIASWNEVYPKETISLQGETNAGYILSAHANIPLSDKQGSKNLLYFPKSSSGFIIYALSSPAHAETNMAAVRCSDFQILYNSTNNANTMTVRPVVCIPSNLLEYNTEISAWDLSL